MNASDESPQDLFLTRTTVCQPQHCFPGIRGGDIYHIFHGFGHFITVCVHFQHLLHFLTNKVMLATSGFTVNVLDTGVKSEQNNNV